MKFLIVLAVIAAVAYAAPAGPEATAKIVKQENDNIGVDGYRTYYETENGIKAEEQAVVKNAGTEGEALEVRGQFSYIGDDGVVYTVNYIANEFGFQPEGAHLPKSP